MLDEFGLVKSNIPANDYIAALRRGINSVEHMEKGISWIDELLYRRVMGHLNKTRQRWGIKPEDSTDAMSDRFQSFELRFGYSTLALKASLEAQFTAGMSWDAVNEQRVHIDHRIPARAFSLHKPEGVRAAYAIGNLQPLHRYDNIRKGLMYDSETVRFFSGAL